MANSSYSISWQQQPQVQPPPQQPPAFGFSQIELRQLFISWAVLTIAFAMMFSGGIQYFEQGDFMELLPISAVAVLTAFVCHELAHKFVAQRFGCWAEFRYWQFGLIIALLFSLMGFLFAAPGAVWIRGRIDKKQNGIISAAGPFSNFAMSAVFAVLAYALIDHSFAGILFFIGFINALIGAFNIIPILPFDGAKVLAWNIAIYIGMAATGGVLVIGIYSEFLF